MSWLFFVSGFGAHWIQFFKFYYKVYLPSLHSASVPSLNSIKDRDWPVQWSVIGRPAWCHIHSVKKCSTLSSSWQLKITVISYNFYNIAYITFINSPVQTAVFSSSQYTVYITLFEGQIPTIIIFLSFRQSIFKSHLLFVRSIFEYS